MRRLQARWRREPFWLPIFFLFVAGLVLYGAHLIAGYTPARVLLTIAPLQLDLYWYGFIIMSGIALGSWVVSVLVAERAEASFRETVPARLRARRLRGRKEDLPAERLNRAGVTTVGGLLWGLTMDAGGLRLKKVERAQALDWLARQDDVDPVWWQDPPWRRWSPDHVWNGVIWCIVLAIIGARLYHVFTPSPSMAALGIETPLDYFRDPLQLINLRNGGLGIFGGIAGGVVGLLIYSRRQRLPAMAWADMATIGVALGQAVGRWGNFFNQELYGRPTTLPWAVTIDPAYRLPEVATSSRFHPAFLYESAWNFLAFLVLYALYRRRRDRLIRGDLTAAYLILYAVGRILVDLVRLDSRLLTLAGTPTPLPVATAVSIIIILVFGAWRLAVHARARRRPAGDS